MCLILRPIQLPPVRGVPTTNSYFYKGPNELVNGYNPPFEGHFDPTLSLINSDTLKLIDDKPSAHLSITTITILDKRLWQV